MTELRSVTTIEAVVRLLEAEEDRVALLAEFEDALNNTDEIDLTVTGRASGRESCRPVWFVRQEDTVYLLPVTGSDTQWYKNLIAAPNIQLTAGGVDYRARATPITEPTEVERVVQMFRDGYGSGDVEEYYPKHDVAVEVRLA